MNKIILSMFLVSMMTCSIGYAATLPSLNKSEFVKAFVNKTSSSIATDNLNGQTIDNTFSMFLDDHGNIIGKMSHKPENEPQTDKGKYVIQKDGTAYITWQNWDGAKKLCFHAFDTQNGGVLRSTG